MVAPHFHDTAEARNAIKKIEHNSGEGTSGPPTGINTGSASVDPHITPGVDEKYKGDDWVSKRGIRPSHG